MLADALLPVSAPLPAELAVLVILLLGQAFRLVRLAIVYAQSAHQQADDFVWPKAELLALGFEALFLLLLVPLDCSFVLAVVWLAVFFVFFSAELVALDLRVEVIKLLRLIQPLELSSPPSESFLDLLARILLLHL